LQSTNQDYQIKKSSLEQLTMLLFDYQGKRGKLLFQEENLGVEDVFSFLMEEVVQAYRTTKEAL
jgi:hypothetical protein